MSTVEQLTGLRKHHVIIIIIIIIIITADDTFCHGVDEQGV